jgi:hypothetical protein
MVFPSQDCMHLTPHPTPPWNRKRRQGPIAELHPQPRCCRPATQHCIGEIFTMPHIVGVKVVTKIWIVFRSHIECWALVVLYISSSLLIFLTLHRLSECESSGAFPEASSHVGTAMPSGRLKSKYQKNALTLRGSVASFVWMIHMLQSAENKSIRTEAPIKLRVETKMRKLKSTMSLSSSRLSKWSTW